MKSGRCPKCKSTIVVTDKGKLSGYRNILNIDAMHAARLQNFVCTECGYVETYVATESLKLLPTLRGHKKWPPALSSD